MPPEDDPADDRYHDDHPDNPKNKDAPVACQTCDKTLQKISDEGNGTWWCAVCGTLFERGTKGFTRWTRPKLVDRARGFESLLRTDASLHPTPAMDQWLRIGVAEAINIPGDRPK